MILVDGITFGRSSKCSYWKTQIHGGYVMKSFHSTGKLGTISRRSFPALYLGVLQNGVTGICQILLSN